MLPSLVRRAMLAASFATLVAGSAQAQAPKHIVIHVYPGSLISLYPSLGISQGFYAKEGLSATLLPLASGPEANAALAGGSINFVLNTGDNLLLAKSRGLPVVAVVGNQIRNFYSFVGAKDLPVKDGASVKEVMTALRSKKVGINAVGTNGERFVRATFKAADASITPQLVPVGGPPSAMAAFAAKSIDAAFMWEPFQTISVLTGGGKVLLDCRVEGQCPAQLEKPGRAFQSYYTSRQFLDANPEAVAGFVRAHQKIDAWVRDPKNRPALVEAVKKLMPPPSGMNIDADTYAKTVVEKSLPTFGVTIDPAGLEAWNEQLLEAKLIPAAVDVKDVVWDKAPRP